MGGEVVTGAVGIDALLAEPERWLGGRERVALLANRASLTSDWTPSVDALRAALGERLVTLLSPEHGFSAFEDDATPIDDRRDPHTGLPLVSLYGPRRRPTPAMMAGFDAVVVDLREVGVRCYTYATTVALVLEAAAAAGTPVVVCDRPSLLGARVDGPALDPERRSFLGYLQVPFQHGLTLGELARHAAAALGGAPLEVVPVPGWRRQRAGASALVTGDPDAGARPSGLLVPPSAGARLAPSPLYPFVPPSPGLPSEAAVALYPGLVLLEGTGLSEGRGTPLPFELLGAPDLDGFALARQINELGAAGVRARPLAFRPDSGKLAGRACDGVQLHVVDAVALRPLRALASVLRLLFVDGRVRWTRCETLPWSRMKGAGEPWHEPTRGLLVDALVGDGSLRGFVEGRQTWDELEQEWAAAHASYLTEVDGALLYPGALEPAGASP